VVFKLSDERLGGAEVPRGCDMRLEVLVVPVGDVDRAKAFYEGLGCRVDYDLVGSNGFRLVQVTPTFSPTSISFGCRVSTATPESIDTHVLTVDDIEAARADLVTHGQTSARCFTAPGWGSVAQASPPARADAILRAVRTHHGHRSATRTGTVGCCRR
jgi:catechol 2,3-dioxygenase-like lactoylglutathione lyase family enzyme